MAIDKYTVPLQKDAGSTVFADNLVGFQLVDGGGLTQGNFNFTVSFSEKVNRTFSTGAFSNPISLETMGLESVAKAKQIFEDNYKVYPNFDTTLVTNFTSYGSLTKRFQVSIERIEVVKLDSFFEAFDSEAILFARFFLINFQPIGPILLAIGVKNQ